MKHFNKQIFHHNKRNEQNMDCRDDVTAPNKEKGQETHVASETQSLIMSPHERNDNKGLRHSRLFCLFGVPKSPYLIRTFTLSLLFSSSSLARGISVPSFPILRAKTTNTQRLGPNLHSLIKFSCMIKNFLG